MGRKDGRNNGKGLLQYCKDNPQKKNQSGEDTSRCERCLLLIGLAWILRVAASLELDGVLILKS